jgi:hypothetical protein
MKGLHWFNGAFAFHRAPIGEKYSGGGPVKMKIKQQRPMKMKTITGR